MQQSFFRRVTISFSLVKKMMLTNRPFFATYLGFYKLGVLYQ